jgi:hypothetical protein
LAGRLTAGGGRESVVRLVLTGAGIAAATAMLLVAAVVLPALHAHDVRKAWTQTRPVNVQPAQDESTTDPLRWREVQDRFDGHDILRVELAAEGPDAPVPPGLDRLPGPGEVALSPALQRLVADHPAAELGDRFPGRVVATIGDEALAEPDDLIAIVGREVDELQARPAPDDRVGPDGTIRVHSIEAAPLSHGPTQSMRFVLTIGAVGLLVPIVVFVATATRLAAARREQRLAALRLAGATQRQVGLVAAVEAGIAAVAGVVVGFGAFYAFRPSLARIPIDGDAFFPGDLRLSPGWAAVIGLGVPALAVAAAMVSLRRTRISPLGVARRAVKGQPSAWPLLLVAGGLVALFVVSLWSQSSTAEQAETYAAAAAFMALIVGFALSGPWLTAMVARAIARFGRRAPSLLAARRLEDNPAAGFRAISGIILAAFVGTVFAALAASNLDRNAVGDGGLASSVVVGALSPVPDDGPVAEPGAGPAPGGPPQWSTVPTAEVARVTGDVAALDGVSQVVLARAFPDDPALFDQLARTGAELSAPVLVACDDVAALGLDAPAACRGATALTVDGSGVHTTSFTTPLAGEQLSALPVVAVAAVTDARVGSIERARTTLSLALPGAGVVTQRDIEATATSGLDTVQRISNIGLAVTLVIAGCSLAVAVAGAIVERRHPLALLRLAGTRLSELRRMVLAEAAAPLLVVAVASVVLGLVVADLVVVSSGRGQDFALPGLAYWLSLVGGLAAALLVVLATLPLLDRLTAPDTARFE